MPACCRSWSEPRPHMQAAYVHDYARRCSRIARVFSTGKSVRGADLWVLELGASRGQDVAKPRFKYLVCGAMSRNAGVMCYCPVTAVFDGDAQSHAPQCLEVSGFLLRLLRA